MILLYSSLVKRRKYFFSQKNPQYKKVSKNYCTVQIFKNVPFSRPPPTCSSSYKFLPPSPLPPSQSRSRESSWLIGTRAIPQPPSSRLSARPRQPRQTQRPTTHSRRNKNRLSSMTCGEELQQIFKEWQSYKGLCQKEPKKSLILNDLCF